MKEAYFVYKDKWANERQSDGVEFCMIPDLYDGKIYFYCSQCDRFWDNIECAGDPSKARIIRLGTRVPATLEQVCFESLCAYISLVKEWEIHKSKSVTITININYIDLTST